MLDMAQHRINGIKQIAAHHTHFVNHKELQITQYALLLPTHLHLIKKLLTRLWRRQKDLRRELKERMNGDSFCIDGRYTRRCNDRQLLGAFLLQAAKKSSLACACLARQEDAAIGMLHIFVC